MRGFVRTSRARLHGWKLDVDSQVVGERIDRATPHSMQVLAIGIERRDRVGAQLERAPDNGDAWIVVCQLPHGRLRQPAEWSNVIGKHLDGYRFHKVTLNAARSGFQRRGKQCLIDPGKRRA